MRWSEEARGLWSLENEPLGRMEIGVCWTRYC